MIVFSVHWPLLFVKWFCFTLTVYENSFICIDESKYFTLKKIEGNDKAV